MTVIERDRAAKKIVDEIIKNIENESDLDVEWDRMDEEDQQRTKKNWLAIAKRFIPVDNTTTKK